MSITILDENDNSPEFDITSDLSVNIPEDTAIGKRVAVVLARDKDAGRNGLVIKRNIFKMLSNKLSVMHNSSPFTLLCSAGQLYLDRGEHAGRV